MLDAGHTVISKTDVPDGGAPWLPLPSFGTCSTSDWDGLAVCPCHVFLGDTP